MTFSACAGSSVALGAAAIRDFACGMNVRLLQPRRVSCYLPALGSNGAWGRDVSAWRSVVDRCGIVVRLRDRKKRAGLLRDDAEDRSAASRTVAHRRASREGLCWDH